MGQQIAFQCAGHGYDVASTTSTRRARGADARIDAYAERARGRRHITAELAGLGAGADHADA